MQYLVRFTDPETSQTASLRIEAADAFEAEALAQAWVRRGLLDEPHKWRCEVHLAKETTAGAA